MGTKNYANAADLVDFARASTGTYLDKDGTLKTSAVDVPRIEYNADGTVRGLLIEEQRTNLLTYSEGSGTSSAPAGWSLLGSGSDPTATTLLNDLGGYLFTGGDRYIRSALSLSATTYTASVFIDPDSTYAGQIISLSGFTGATGSLTATAEDADENGRVFITFTLAGDVSGDVRIGQINSNSGELNIGGWQLEEGSFPTSYIPTEGSQATRAADICSIDTDQFGYNQDAGTLVVNVNTFDTEYSNWVWMLDGTSDTSLYGHSAANGWRVFGAGGTVSYLGSLPENADATIGYTYSNAGSATVLDGGSVETQVHSQPVAVTTMRLGAASSSSAFLNGHIKSMDYYPRRLTDEQLQELTS